MSVISIQRSTRSGNLFSQLVNGHLQRIQRDQVTIQDAGGSRVFGQLSEPELAVRLLVHSPAFYRKAVFGGALGAAESYLQGHWSCDALTDFMRIMLRNEHVLHSVQSWWSLVSRAVDRVRHWMNHNSPEGSQRNIREHYDLGNDFFRLFLDETMLYSSAIFEDSGASLKEASLSKLDRVCRTLQLKPSDRVVEIGSGWGSFAVHAARQYGCHVTTTTISREQFQWTCRRVQEEGLSDRVTVLQQDYRDLQGSFDKLVSLEMIEAVGRRYLPAYFAACDRLLNSRGAMLLQAITMPEQRHARYLRSAEFIQTYVFPGGYLPTIAEIQETLRDNSGLRLLGLQDFGMHYARTLKCWNERFHERLDDVRQLGFSERFIRMWRYYLCYCEAAFLERATGVVQAVWAKPESDLGTIR